MAEPFAGVEDVQRRLDFDMSPAEQRVCESALDDMSEQARFEGGKAWEIPEDAPRMVRTIVLASVVRYMKNLDGLVQSRAADETLGFTDLGDKAGSAYFTQAEVQTLQALGGHGKGGIVSAQVTAYRTSWHGRGHHPSTLVNVADSTQPFPFNEECW